MFHVLQMANRMSADEVVAVLKKELGMLSIKVRGTSHLYCMSSTGWRESGFARVI